MQAGVDHLAQELHSATEENSLLQQQLNKSSAKVQACLKAEMHISKGQYETVGQAQLNALFSLNYSIVF